MEAWFDARRKRRKADQVLARFVLNPWQEREGRTDYFVTVMFRFEVLLPAFDDVTSKLALILPGLFGTSFALTVLVEPAGMLPTDELKLTPCH